jgi:hypothetical protein
VRYLMLFGFATLAGTFGWAGAQEPALPFKSSPLFAVVTKIDRDKMQITYTWRWFRPVPVTTIENNSSTVKTKTVVQLVGTPRTAVFDASKGFVLDRRGQKLNDNEALARLKIGSTVFVAFEGYEIDTNYLEVISGDALILLDPRPNAKTKNLLINLE